MELEWRELGQAGSVLDHQRGFWEVKQKQRQGLSNEHYRIACTDPRFSCSTIPGF